MISIVIPTYKEADSIQDVIRRSGKAFKECGEGYELIVVDDNNGDGTAELAEELSSEFPVRVVRRPERQGLATAVVDGWKVAQGDLLGVIDADLQHPPEILSALAAALRRTKTDLAATVLPLKLCAVSDPMSGMFMVRASAIAGADLSPLGYKILLEVLAKGRINHVVEVPYQFEERIRGSSKLGARQYGEYLAHLGRLSFATGQFRAWLEYSLVGLTGAALDIAAVSLIAGRASGRAVWVYLWRLKQPCCGTSCGTRMQLSRGVCGIAQQRQKVRLASGFTRKSACPAPC